MLLCFRYKDILDEAICQSTHQPRKCIIYQRRRVLECTLEKDRDICWEEALEAEPVPCVSVEANEPLYILYTSGNNLISINSSIKFTNQLSVNKSNYTEFVFFIISSDGAIKSWML